MKFEKKHVLPSLASLGLIVSMFLGRPNWQALPHRTPSAVAGTKTETPTFPKYGVPTDKLIIGSIDSHDEALRVHGESDKLLEAFGWIASTESDDPIKKVNVYINGRLMATVHSLSPRPDIVATFDRPDFEFSGWRAVIPLDGMKAGEYEFAVRATTVTGKEGALVSLKLFVSE